MQLAAFMKPFSFASRNHSRFVAFIIYPLLYTEFIVYKHGVFYYFPGFPVFPHNTDRFAFKNHISSSYRNSCEVNPSKLCNVLVLPACIPEKVKKTNRCPHFNTVFLSVLSVSHLGYHTLSISRIFLGEYSGNSSHTYFNACSLSIPSFSRHLNWAFIPSSLFRA